MFDLIVDGIHIKEGFVFNTKSGRGTVYYKKVENPYDGTCDSDYWLGFEHYPSLRIEQCYNNKWQCVSNRYGEIDPKLDVISIWDPLECNYVWKNKCRMICTGCELKKECPVEAEMAPCHICSSKVNLVQIEEGKYSVHCGNCKFLLHSDDRCASRIETMDLWRKITTLKKKVKQ